MNFENADRIMRAGIREGVFPGASLLAGFEGAIRYYEVYGVRNYATGLKVTRDTFFDLASLTKPLATTLAVMDLYQSKALDLESSVSRVFTEWTGTPKEAVTFAHLLRHLSGLPGYRPYYRLTRDVPDDQRLGFVRRKLLEEPLEAPAGDTVIYSDLGFMVLEWAIEKMCGLRLDRYVKKIYSHMGVPDTLFFNPMECRKEAAYAATEECGWRGKVMEGMVHDENAYVMGGVAGHAGLFGTAEAVFMVLNDLLSMGYGSKRTGIYTGDTIRRFLTAGTGRPLGFDRPTPPEPSCGRYFSNKTVGHLGFTGTSFWMDLETSLIVVLLTNRVHPARSHTAIRAFRPMLHDAIAYQVTGQR